MPATPARKAIIIGAGVGGLSAAIALQRAGIETVVLERHADPRTIESGGAFILWNNAMKALARLELAADVERAGAALEVAEWRTPRGQAIASWPVGDISREVGASAIGVRRTDLQSTLVRAAGDLRLGVRCVGFSEDPDGVTVRIADGGTERGDVLIGADGIRSMVRAHLHGSFEPPRHAGYWQYFGIADAETELTSERIFLEIDGPGRRFFAFPVGAGQTYWAAATTGRRSDQRVRVGAAGSKQDVLQRFHGWARPVGELLEATPEAAIYRREIADRDPTRTWGRGPITLLGDAAHPITPNLGQGACQAIEDAVVLAHHLGGATDPISALRAYELSRFERTASFVRRARLIASMGRWRNPMSCFVREQIAMRAIPGPALRRHRRDMAYAF
jgi:2-polyprenyl-6-methoxyphenol hydroxylase-like FAD-dependent oxidoreductase